MKRKYCLIRTDGDLNPSSFVYVVWVGSSLRESTQLALVEEFCKDCGWYFKLWSSTVDSVLEKRAKLKRADGTRCVPPFSMMSINIDTCYQTIIDDSWTALESRHVMTPQEKFMRFRRDPDYLKSLHHARCITSCSPSKRKYLSHRHSRAFYELGAPMIVIVILIVLDHLVSTQILTHLF